MPSAVPTTHLLHEPGGVRVVHDTPLTVELVLTSDTHSLRRLRLAAYMLLAAAALILLVLLGIVIRLVPDPGFHVRTALLYSVPFLFPAALTLLAFDPGFRRAKGLLELREGELITSVRNYWVKVPTDDLLGLAVEVTNARCWFDGLLPPPKEINRSDTGALILRVPDGWIRTLAGFSVAQLLWVVDRLQDQVAIPRLPPGGLERAPEPMVQPGQMTRPLWWYCALMLPVIAVAVLWAWASEIQPGLASARWPTAEATVLESGYETFRSRRGSDHRVTFRYRYEIDGVVMESDRLSFERASAEPAVRRFVEEHPPGSVVLVHYDPSDPRRAAPLTGTDPIFIGLAAVGAVSIIALAIWLPFAYPRPRHVRLQRRYIDGARQWREAWSGGSGR